MLEQLKKSDIDEVRTIGQFLNQLWEDGVRPHGVT